MALHTEHRVARLRFGSFMAGLAIFCLFAVLAYWGFFQSNPLQTYEDSREKSRMERLVTLHKDDHRKLSDYDWVDQKKGVLHVPIDRAIELVLPELKAKPVQASAVKLEHPYPAGLQTLVVAASGVPAPAVTGTAAATGTSAVTGTASVTGTAAAPVASPIPATSPKQ